MSCAVFLDGAYLEKVLTIDFGQQEISMEKLALELAKPEELLRAYYYHCPPFQSNPPTPEEKERYSRRHRFYTALSYIPRFEVRLGRLAFRGLDEYGKEIFIQKRVDCMIGVDMAILASKERITSVSLLSGDSDLIPAIEAVKREGVVVALWHGSTKDSLPGVDIVQISDLRFPINQEFINKVLR